MKKTHLFRTLIFLIIGIGIFIYIYKDLQLDQIGNTLSSLKYEWIVLSGIFGLASHFVRTLRWQLLIEPLAHKPNTLNTYLAVLILYLFNILIPRGGEIARCTALNRYEKIPFPKLLGTVVTERLSDLAIFALILVALIIWDSPVIDNFFNNNPRLVDGFRNTIHSEYFYLTLLVIAGAGFFIFYSRGGSNSTLMDKILKVKEQFREGISTISRTKSSLLYVFYTLSIIFLWLLMLYVVFFAYEPTSNLSFKIAVITFAISSFAFILPIQAGIGAWHYLVIQVLFLFGIDKDIGAVFALIAHTFTNLIFLIVGTVAFIILPLVNSEKESVKLKDITQSKEI
ncbi:MAG: flippase-like domain-containing protein [Bacteroidales bacterium]|nr:flippase-like domain-containing protein [Bacteroidales bacterium]